MTATHRLATILAADVVGYSCLMGEDEAGRGALPLSRPQEWHAQVQLLASIECDARRG
jgi:hypothetical protein